MSGEGRSFSHFSYYAGAGWDVRCNTYPDTTPILCVDGGPSQVSISTRGRDADDNAVEFARALAREVQKFADEIERMHAARLAEDSTDKAASSDAA